VTPLVAGVVDRIVPPRLGRDFRLLLASSWVSNIGDGIALAAGPLLVASVTRDPLLVSLAALLQRLPWVVVGLYAGVLADRLDRRALTVVVELARAAVLAVLTVTIVTGTVNVPVVLGAMFLLGVTETFADTAAPAMMPMLVERKDLGIANARLMFGFITLNQLAGPPIGAFLFALGSAYPFVGQAVAVALGALLVARMRLPELPAREPSHVRRDVAEGFRWLLAHPPVRTLALTILVFNITWGCSWAVLVLYAQEQLGLDAVGFGFLTTVSAVGGLLGTAAYGAIERRVHLGVVMRVGLVIETLTHVGLALTTSPAVAMVIMFVFGAHAFIWGTTSRTVRQRAVPTAFQGRVSSVYMLGLMGGLVIGQALAGPIARAGGITAPFWFAGIGSALMLVAVWRQLMHIAHAEAEEA
jgi:MFS family permease